MEQNEIVSKDILNLLPHRYPFLLVDRVVAFEKMHSVHAIKCVTFNEPFFQGHFPGYPVMPGVLILEAMAQASGVLILKSHPDDLQGKIFLFAGLENVRFRKPVVPGDTLHLHIEYDRHKRNLWRTRGRAFVEEQLVAQADLSAAIVDREEKR